MLAAVLIGLAHLFVRAFFGCGEVFARLPVADWVKPGIGGLLTGALAVALYAEFDGDTAVLAVLGTGYGSLQATLRGESVLAVLIAVALGKTVTTSLTLGSGNAGGIFGPLVVIGGSAGAAVGLTVRLLDPALAPEPASFAVVGMAGFFAALTRTPFAALVFVCELTGGYSLLVPALWVCLLCFLFSGDVSLFRAQLGGRAESQTHRRETVLSVLDELRVGDHVRPGQAQGPVLSADDTLLTAMRLFEQSGANELPVTSMGRSVGVLRRFDVVLRLRFRTRDGRARK